MSNEVTNGAAGGAEEKKNVKKPGKKPSTERKAKVETPFVVGAWFGGNFVPSEPQPVEPITELNKIIAWAKKTYGESGGEFEFIRKVPGKLVLASRRVTTAEYRA